MDLKKNQQLELKIASFGAQGEGVAKYEGMPIFIPYALPGETIKALIVKVEKKYAFGKVLEVISASPERNKPSCPIFYQCGGCVCQHMSYAAQLAFKRNQVENCMRHIAGLDIEVRPVLGMANSWHYRNKISMPVAGTSDTPLIGYYAQRSHRVIDTDACLLSMQPNDKVCRLIRQWMIQEKIPPYQEETHSGLVRHIMTRINRRGQLMLVMVINGKTLKKADILLDMLRQQVPEMVSFCVSSNEKRGNVILGDSYQALWGQERLEDQLCGNRFFLSPLSFFQINPLQTEKLYNTALDFADLRGDETVADLYCGAGTISLMLAKKAAYVVGVEIVPDAIKDAEKNAQINNITNVSFICGATELVLPKLVGDGMRPDVIVLDPPRKGAEKSVLEAIIACGPRRVVYVSCNPATQARDARILADGGYHPQWCQPVDMFCQTAGVENVMLFAK